MLFDSPPADAAAGFAVLLRHFYAPGEKASVETLLKLLRTHAAKERSSEQPEQFTQLDAWKRVEGMTRQRSVQNQAIKKLIAWMAERRTTPTSRRIPMSQSQSKS